MGLSCLIAHTIFCRLKDILSIKKKDLIYFIITKLFSTRERNKTFFRFFVELTIATIEIVTLLMSFLGYTALQPTQHNTIF